MPREYFQYRVMKHMGISDYYTYLAQPDWWMEAIAQFMELEANADKKASLRAQQRSKHPSSKPGNFTVTRKVAD